MRITTWNINSVRLRLPLAMKLIEELQPDVLCLQETKVNDAKFPRAAFAEAGYVHQQIHGQNGYHGVATLSRLPLDGLETHDWGGYGHARHGVCRLPGGIELHNLYVPSGGDVPDPDSNDKFAHKLDFLAHMRKHFAALRDPARKLIVLGDLNIAPLEHDVWSHKQMLDVVSHTPIEVDGLNKWREDGGFIDTCRCFVPEDEKLFSWWSYRARDWRASNRGRRLDHIWITPALAPGLRAATILSDARGWERPSDHVPVSVDLDV